MSRFLESSCCTGYLGMLKALVTLVHLLACLGMFPGLAAQEHLSRTPTRHSDVLVTSGHCLSWLLWIFLAVLVTEEHLQSRLLGNVCCPGLIKHSCCFPRLVLASSLILWSTPDPPRELAIVFVVWQTVMVVFIVWQTVTVEVQHVRDERMNQTAVSFWATVHYGCAKNNSFWKYCSVSQQVWNILLHTLLCFVRFR